MAGESDNREERIAALQEELAALTTEAVEEVDEALTTAEEAVAGEAEGVGEAAHAAHEEAREHEAAVESTVQEHAAEAAEQLGNPELAGQISDHLFQRLHDSGLLPHERHDPPALVPEAGESVEHVAEVPAEAAATVEQDAAHVTRDAPPTASHWWYRPVFGRRH